VAQLFAVIYLVVVTGVPTWHMPCCDSESMDCCSSEENASQAPCCAPVFMINVLQVEVTLATLPTLPAPLCATLPEAPHTQNLLDVYPDVITPKCVSVRSGPLILPPLSLLEKFLI